MAHQVEIYLRWVQYLLQVKLKDRQVILLNMDETSLSSKIATKYGVFAQQHADEHRNHDVGSPRQRSWTCMLKALICSDHTMMKHLPQVMMPKYRNGDSPPAALKVSYESMGQPLEAWHKSSGWATSTSMLLWLRTLSKRLKTLAPQAECVLLLDCASTHVNARFLMDAIRLKIHVLIVPAGCTWLLQPLDVYVFGPFKRALRKRLSLWQVQSRSSIIDIHTRISLTGETLQKELVAKSWAEKMKRVGLSHSVEGLNKKLRILTKNSNLSPQAPTKDDLELLLGKGARMNRVDWQKLLVRGPIAKSVCPGAATGGALASQDTPLPPILRLNKLGSKSSLIVSTLHSAGSASEDPVRPAEIPRTVVPIKLRLWNKLPPSAKRTQVPPATPSSSSSSAHGAVNYDINGLQQVRVGPCAGTRKHSAELKQQQLQTE